MKKTKAADAPSPQLVAALGQVGLFSGLPKKTLQQMAEMCREHHFSVGDAIVTEGETSGRFYVIVEGGAEVQVHGHTVNLLGPGQYFGEIAVIDAQPRSATVIAQTPVRAYSLAAMALKPVLREQPEVTYRLLLNACDRIRATQNAMH